MTDIFRCKICKTHVLADEIDYHTCKNITNMKIEQDKLLVSDGEHWYPLKLNKIPRKVLGKILSCPDITQLNFCPADYTEPKTGNRDGRREGS